MTTENNFKQINDKQIISNLLADVISHQTQIWIKVENYKTINSTLVLFKESSLFLKLEFQELHKNLIGTKIFCQFTLAGEKYFFNGILKVENIQLVITQVKQIFLLQRRNNFRVKIPPNYGAYLIFKKINGSDCEIKSQLLDFGAGGVKAKLAKIHFPLIEGDPVNVILKIHTKDEISLLGEIKNISTHYYEADFISFGVMFTNINPEMEARLFSIANDLYRELYSKTNL